MAGQSDQDIIAQGVTAEELLDAKEDLLDIEEQEDQQQ